MLQVLLVNLMVAGLYSVLNVEGGPPQMPMPISVKLNLGGRVVREPPSQIMGRRLKGPPPNNLSPQQ